MNPLKSITMRKVKNGNVIDITPVKVYEINSLAKSVFQTKKGNNTSNLKGYIPNKGWIKLHGVVLDNAFEYRTVTAFGTVYSEHGTVGGKENFGGVTELLLEIY